METILIVDDEKNYPFVIGQVLKEEGFDFLTANSGIQALEILKNSDIDLVLTDIKMPSMDGIKLLEKIKKHHYDIPVIMMTAYGTVKNAVEAMQKGAHNYILKPFDNENLIVYINKALEMHKLIKTNKRLLAETESKYSFGNIIGKSKGMQDIFYLIKKVAPTDASVLITGESGTGKELVAKALHFNSPRKNNSFIPVNCAALAETLLESELFGHEKGAFTGAIAKKKGRFELADKGTIFLDEIGEISPSLQVKLLRVLQDKTFERVGGVDPVKVDIRIIAATNKDLLNAIESGGFREDLFYRLNVVTIKLPPLRERKEDINILIEHFLKKYAPKYKSDPNNVTIEKKVEKIFYDYEWPGNVRELENTIERALVLSDGNEIKETDVPDSFKEIIKNNLALKWITPDAKLNDSLASVEKSMIIRALKLANNVQAHAAEILGIGKSGLNQKIKKYKI